MGSPRQGEPSDDVRLRGEPQLVAKLKTELEKSVIALRDRVVLAIEIPAAQHRALIGRGGQHLNDMQTRYSVQIQFPGSRSYSQVGEAENADTFKGVEPANIVKISGSHAACAKAIEDLKVIYYIALSHIIVNIIMFRVRSNQLPPKTSLTRFRFLSNIIMSFRNKEISFGTSALSVCK